MEDETTAAEPTGAGEAAAGPREEPDYRALYEEQRAEAERLKAESRKWERRSKENLDAAKQARSAARKSVEEEVADLRAQLRRMEEERAHAELVSGVASAKGVPAELLRGDDEEELNASADALLAFVRSQAPAAPQDKGGSPAGGARLTAEQIGRMRSPLERVRAYAIEHAGQ